MSEENNPQVLDEDNWKKEAAVIIQDIKDHVKYIRLSETLMTTNQHIFFNLTTIEGDNYCIELSKSGFRVAGSAFDRTDSLQDTFYETPYALLTKISPQFYKSFGNSLLEKLQALNQNPD